MILGARFAYVWDRFDHAWHGKSSSGTIADGSSGHQLGLIYGSSFAYAYDRATRKWMGKGTPTPITKGRVSWENGDLAYIYGGNYVYVTVSGSGMWYGKGTSETIKVVSAQDDLYLVVCSNVAYVFDASDRTYHGKGLTGIVFGGATPSFAYIHNLKTVWIYRT